MGPKSVTGGSISSLDTLAIGEMTRPNGTPIDRKNIIINKNKL